MTRQFALMAGVAALSGAAGLTTLVRPEVTRRALRLPAGEPALYALRIGGMMLTALGLFLGGFAAVAAMAGAA